VRCAIDLTGAPSRHTVGFARVADALALLRRLQSFFAMMSWSIVLIEREIGDQPLEFGIFLAQLAQLTDLWSPKPAEALPGVEGGLASLQMISTTSVPTSARRKACAICSGKCRFRMGKISGRGVDFAEISRVPSVSIFGWGPIRATSLTPPSSSNHHEILRCPYINGYAVGKP